MNVENDLGIIVEVFVKVRLVLIEAISSRSAEQDTHSEATYLLLRPSHFSWARISCWRNKKVVTIASDLRMLLLFY